MKSKKAMTSWVWILIILILIAIGVGIYFWLTGSSEGVSSIYGGGNSIPQPPALPE